MKRAVEPAEHLIDEHPFLVHRGSLAVTLSSALQASIKLLVLKRKCIEPYQGNRDLDLMILVV